MTTFYVGQRVQLYRPKHPHNLGCLGIIVAIGPFRRDQLLFLNNEIFRFPERCDCVVDWQDGDIPGICDFYQLIPHGDTHQPAEISVEELLPFLKAKERV